MSNNDALNAKVANTTVTSSLGVSGILKSNLNDYEYTGTADAAKVANVNKSNDTISTELSSNWYYDSYATGVTAVSPIYPSDLKIELNNYFDSNSAELQFSILENYFKMEYVKNNNYDRQLNKNEILDLMSFYLKEITDKECKVEFHKKMLHETFTFNLDNNISFKIDNKNDLFPSTYVYFENTFYVNTDNLLAIIKKAAFNRLLNV